MVHSTVLPTQIKTDTLVTSSQSSSSAIASTNYPSLSPSTAFIISTVAGMGSIAYSGDNGAATAAGIGYPSGVALDSSGRLIHVIQYRCYIDFILVLSP